MAVDLLNRFSNFISKTDTASYQTAESSEAKMSPQAQKLLQAAVKSLAVGQSLQGEVVSFQKSDVTILFGDSLLLHAKLEGEMALVKGQMMTFEVKSNQDGKLALRPLYANTDIEPNAFKALDLAGIPVTEKSAAVVNELMNLGMPINKENLTQIFRQIARFPQADPVDVIMLQKMNLPVNEGNIEQMQLYRTNNQEIFGSLSDMGDEIIKMLQEFADQGAEPQLETFVGRLVQIFDGQTMESPVLQQNADSNEEIVPKEGEGSSEQIKASSESINGRQPQIDEKAADEALVKTDGKVAIRQDGKIVIPEKNPMMPEAEKILEWIKSGALKSQTGRENIKESIFSMLKQQMLMDPKNIEKPEYVKEYYQKVLDKTKQVEELLKDVGREDSALGKQTAGIKNNISFINQVNEFYHYIQLPLKMNDAQASGDLYVYKRKHSKTGDDGKLTALLHLSMPTLGNMDIFLTLEKERLNTRFCMEKEEMIDFMEAHMDLLNERLQKKGYQISTNVGRMQQEDRSVAEKIIEQDPGVRILSKQSFDARA